jgi:hypothetical protein
MMKEEITSTSCSSVLVSFILGMVVSGKCSGKWKENNREEQKGGYRVPALCSVRCLR